MTSRQRLLKPGESGKTLDARLRTSGMTGEKVKCAVAIGEENL